MRPGKRDDRIGKDLVAASATPLLLAILAKGPSYGYAIIQEVRELSGGELEWSEGMLYPVLHRLEDQGLIEAYEERGDTGRKRRYYRLRAEGRSALAAERRQWQVVHAALAKAWRTT
jgi:DNA-binding PadR family transcriptional regulator